MKRKPMPKPSRPHADKRKGSRMHEKLKALNHEPYWCDHCGRESELVPVDSLPCDIASANKGESAHLCHDCHEKFHTGR